MRIVLAEQFLWANSFLCPPAELRRGCDTSFSYNPQSKMYLVIKLPAS